MNLARHYAAVFLIMLVAGCAQLGIPSPDTFNQKLAVGYSTVTAVRATSTNLLKAKKLSPQDDGNVQSAADNARMGLDVARTLSSTDVPAATNKLTAVVTALTALQAYLTTKGN